MVPGQEAADLGEFDPMLGFDTDAGFEVSEDGYLREVERPATVGRDEVPATPMISEAATSAQVRRKYEEARRDRLAVGLIRRAERRQKLHAD